MRTIITIAVFTLLTTSLVAQSRIENMLLQKRYKELAELAPQANKYSGKDIFHIGQAFIKLEQDEKAVEMFQAAINKGYKTGELYYAQGIALVNLESYDEAISSFEQALYFLPKRKKVLIELAGAYYKNNNLDSAYSTYYTVANNWGDYFPAQIMLCQISHEQEKYKEALDCYYLKLKAFKKDPFYYREALEEIVRLEWHRFKRYDKAEIALKNLIDAFPDNYEYTMQLMQLYNYLGQYADAALLENLMLDGYKNLKLAQSFYQRGVMLVDQFDTAQYHMESFRVFQPEKQNGCFYKTFIFTFDGSRPLGKAEAFKNATATYLQGYALDTALRIDTAFSYAAVKQLYLEAIFSPDSSFLDTTGAY